MRTFLQQLRSDQNLALKTQSRIISMSRFPLTVFVVIIHVLSATDTMAKSVMQDISGRPILNLLFLVFRQGVLNLAVPTFFLTSGLFFYYQKDGYEFTRSTYIKKISSRAKTLLIPYLFWNISAMIIDLFLYRLTGMTAQLNRPPDHSQLFLLQSLWSVPRGDGYPFVFPLWYLRDLIVLSAASPIIYFMIKKTKIFSLIFFFALKVFAVPLVLVSQEGLLFFSLGAYISINNKTLFSFADKKLALGLIAYPILAIAIVYMPGSQLRTAVNYLCILAGIFCLFLLLTAIALKNKPKSPGKIMRVVGTSSFFVYAIHEPFVGWGLRKGLAVFLQPDTTLNLILFIIISTVLTTVVAVTFFAVLQKFLPKFTSFISGGRL